MSDQRPDKAEPPYPGWSTEQPPERPAVPGQQDQGWQSPGGTSADAGQGAQHSDRAAEPPPATPPADGQQSWGAPSGPGGHGQSWSSQPQWGWAAPTAKPGVIPLRPLGVGEVLDGAVTTIRKNIGAMLGLSVVVATLIQLGGLYFNWTIFDGLNELTLLPTTASDDQILGLFSDVAQAGFVYLAIEWLGRTILTGILTVVVSRAVLGEHTTAGEAWRRARRRIPRLLGLTVVYSLIAAAPVVAAVLLTIALGVAGGPGAAAIGLILIPAGFVLTVWLGIRYVLATPIVMIETVHSPNGAPAPVGIGGSLRRSSDLVRGSWWRVFGIYLLILVIMYVIANAMSFTVSLPTTFADPAEGIGFGSILLIALGGVLATAVTAPFVAGAVALLYIDRRIRAEGLDIELARAAGVSIPGRTDTSPGRTDEPPGGTAQGPGPDNQQP